MRAFSSQKLWTPNTQILSLSREYVTCSFTQEAPAPRNAAWKNPHCAACAVVAFPAARGQPCPTHLRHLGLPVGCTCSGARTMSLTAPLPRATSGPPLHSSFCFSLLDPRLPPETLWFWNVPHQVHLGSGFAKAKVIRCNHSTTANQNYTVCCTW